MAKFSINGVRLRIWALTAPVSQVTALSVMARDRAAQIGETGVAPFEPLERAHDNPGVDEDGVRRWVREHEFVTEVEGETVRDEEGIRLLLGLAAISHLTSPPKVAIDDLVGEPESPAAEESDTEDGEGDGEGENASTEGGEGEGGSDPEGESGGGEGGTE